MNEHANKILQGVVGLVGELEKIGVTKTAQTGGNDTTVVTQLNQAYSAYQDRLARGEHAVKALERLEEDVARLLGRDRYEFETK